VSWETVIGLEVHAQLATRTKLFCACPTTFGTAPNSVACPVCTGQPGALPVLNAEAVRLAVRAALALGAELVPESRFARKHYFYPDLPKGFQITQYEEPYARGGAMPMPEGHSLALTRMHLEEDAGKALHDRGHLVTLVDLNRAGIALLEIVGEPELRSAREAGDSLRSLREILRWIGASHCEMAKGELRCDVNVSVRRPGAPPGTKVEIKNLNSFRHVEAAIEEESARQIALLEAGTAVVQETRLFDAAGGRTAPMRTKEDARDYRYLAEPDLPALRLDPALVEEERARLGELPAERRARFVTELGLSPYDAGVLTGERTLADWFEGVVRAGASPKTAANWTTNELLRALADPGRPVDTVDQLPFRPLDLAALLGLVREGRLSPDGARRVFDRMLSSGGEPAELMAELGLSEPAAEDEVAAWCRAAIESRPDAVEALLAGRGRALDALVGAALAASGGRGDPRVLRGVLERLVRHQS